MSSRTVVGLIAALRATLGVGALLAPRRTAALFGFPLEQQTAMTTLIGRWFGVRELVLAALAVSGHGGPRVARGRRLSRRARERQFARLNVVNDAVDAAAMVVPLVRREGIDRPQLIGIPVALAVSAGWLRALRERR